MEKIFTTKNLMILGIILFCMICLSTCKSCSTYNETKKMRKEFDSLQVLVDGMYTKSELDTRMEIEGLRVSKRTLYDWNSVVRTQVRPDDQMAEYDKQIKVLEDKLK